MVSRKSENTQQNYFGFYVRAHSFYLHIDGTFYFVLLFSKVNKEGKTMSSTISKILAQSLLATTVFTSAALATEPVSETNTDISIDVAECITTLDELGLKDSFKSIICDSLADASTSQEASFSPPTGQSLAEGFIKERDAKKATQQPEAEPRTLDVETEIRGDLPKQEPYNTPLIEQTVRNNSIVEPTVREAFKGNVTVRPDLKLPEKYYVQEPTGPANN